MGERVAMISLHTSPLDQPGTGDAVAVRAVVGVASALLALSAIEAFRPADTSWYDGFWGVVALVLGGLALVRGRGRWTSRRPAGAHAR